MPESNLPNNSRPTNLHEKPLDTPSPPRSALKSMILIASCTGTMLAFNASEASASIAMPSLGHKLDIGEDKLQWLISAFSLSSGCLLLLFGRLADLHGRKKMFLLGCLLQAAFSFGCGFAQDEISVDILRGLQGCGAAATIPACLGILAQSFPPSRLRSLAFATFSAGAAMGAAVGNVLGAVLTQLSTPGWRSVYYSITGLNILCMIGGAFSVDPDQPSAEFDKRVDYLGAFLATAGLTLILFALSDASITEGRWSTPYISALLILGVLFVLAFLLWQSHLENQLDRSTRLPPPIVKISMWSRANGSFAVTQLIAFTTWCSFMPWNFWVQLFYQDYMELTPILTMVRLLPMFVAGIICNVLVVLFVGRVDLVYLMMLGIALTSAANLFLAVVHSSWQPYWAYGFPSSILSSFGADLVFASGTLFIAKVSLPHEQSVASALFQTMTQLGTSFGLAITTVTFNRVRSNQSKKMGVVIDPLGDNVPMEAQLFAYSAAGWGAFGFGIAGTLLAAIFLRGTGVVGHSEPIQAGSRNNSGESTNVPGGNIVHHEDQEQNSISA